MVVGADRGRMMPSMRVWRRSTSSSAHRELEPEKGWVKCIGVHRVCEVEEFGMLLNMVLANWRPVEDRLIFGLLLKGGGRRLACPTRDEPGLFFLETFSVRESERETASELLQSGPQKDTPASSTHARGLPAPACPRLPKLRFQPASRESAAVPAKLPSRLPKFRIPSLAPHHPPLLPAPRARALILFLETVFFPFSPFL